MQRGTKLGDEEERRTEQKKNLYTSTVSPLKLSRIVIVIIIFIILLRRTGLIATTASALSGKGLGNAGTHNYINLPFAATLVVSLVRIASTTAVMVAVMLVRDALFSSLLPRNTARKYVSVHSQIQEGKNIYLRSYRATSDPGPSDCCIY